MKKHFLLSGVAASLVLSACSSVDFETKKIDYKSTSKAKVSTLEIPPDLTNPAKDDRFLVPDSGGKGTATFSAYSGERKIEGQTSASSVLPQVDKAYIDRDGSQRWLVVAQSPDKLWASIKDFWQELGFTMNIETPEAGIMETDWAENRANIGGDFLRNWLGKMLDSLYSTAERDKFRTRLEPGKSPGTTEIYISHRGMYETFISEGKDQTRWQPREPEPDLEAEMLRRLMIYFGSDQERAKTQIAQSKNAPLTERAKMVRNDKEAQMLVVDESFDRTWRRVGLALDRVGFTVEDRDRTQGIYFVRYVDPEIATAKEKEGFFSKLAFWKGTPPPNTQYRVLVKQSGAQQSQVTVLNSDKPAEPGKAQVDSPETRQKILTLLHNQLK